MNEQETIIFIKNAMEQSRNALAELMLSAPKVFKRRTELLGEYYSNLENCKKEIQSCEIAIKALEEIQQYRAIGTVNEFKALKEERVECFESNGDPYPLCKGTKSEECHDCCLYEDYEEYHSPY